MEKLKGVLVYSGQWGSRPWKLIQEGGKEIDLYPLINETLNKMNGKPAVQHLDRESYSLMLEDSAEYAVKYETDRIALLMHTSDGFSMHNLGAYLPESLTWFSGRKVEVEFSDNGLKITADPTEQVFGVQFFGRGNSCRIPEGAEKSVCKIGTSDCCIFATVGEGGYICQKFSGSMALHLLHRHFEGTMNSSRVGNCALVGREEDTTPKDPNTPPMSFETKRGDKVLFDKPNRGHEHDTKHALKNLAVGGKYTVERLEVAEWSSRVFFKEVPGVGFNTVHFKNIELESSEAAA